jgi:adenylosuccinate lyase
MIERYEVKEISNIWSSENKFRKWLDVELAITEVWYQWGEVPEESFNTIKEKANFNVDRIDEIEKKVKHDVIAFLTSVEEFVGKDSAYIHKGITSYDIVDTALSLLIRESLDIIIPKTEDLKELLIKKAFEYKNLTAIGRTHGIHAEPIAFGVKYLIWYEEIKRNIQRLINAREIISVGKISGSVGTYIHFPPEGEEGALKKLNLTPCKVSSQIIQRDRHMEVIYALASLGSAIEKIAVEIRHLQRTEVLEVEEPFTKGQKGSSSMPHKRNPVKCERISGLARLLRGNLTVAFENNILWHERDISHSSAERVIFPDCFHAAAFMLEDITRVIQGLNVYPDNIKRNLDITNEVYYSQKVLTLLLDKGLPRQKVYELVQKNALESWTQKKSFRKLISEDEEIKTLCTEEELEKAFSEKDLMAGIDKIFERFKNATKAPSHQETQRDDSF